LLSFRKGRDVSFTTIGERPDDYIAAVGRPENRRHRFQRANEEKVQQKRPAIIPKSAIACPVTRSNLIFNLFSAISIVLFSHVFPALACHV
jgi:hypothetical protein